MTTSASVRSQVATLANALRYQMGLSASAAMSKAWKVVKLKQAMREGVAHFTYLKKGEGDRPGELRPAVGTLRSDISGYTPKATTKPRKRNPLYVRYFDVARGGFRQFAAARLQ